MECNYVLPATETTKNMHVIPRGKNLERRKLSNVKFSNNVMENPNSLHWLSSSDSDASDEDDDNFMRRRSVSQPVTPRDIERASSTEDITKSEPRLLCQGIEAQVQPTLYRQMSPEIRKKIGRQPTTTDSSECVGVDQENDDVAPSTGEEISSSSDIIEHSSSPLQPQIPFSWQPSIVQREEWIQLFKELSDSNMESHIPSRWMEG
jgi:hypothetical protein